MVKSIKPVISLILIASILLACFTMPPVAAAAEETVYTLQNGGVVFEAEDTASSGKIKIINNPNASAGKSLAFLKPPARVDDPAAYGTPAASYSFQVDTAGTYYVWIRTLALNTGTDSLWSNLDTNAYVRADLTVHPTDWTWAKMNSAQLSPGIHTLNLVPREAGQEMDRIIITNNGAYTPRGVGDLEDTNAPGPVVYPAPPVLPPAGHPRVYFTADDIPRILANAQKPQNASAWAKHESNLLETAVDTINPPTGSATDNFSASVLSVIESRAFDYAIRGNEPMGLRAVTAMRSYIDTAVGGDYNKLGQTVFTIAAVYDWCYPLLTAQDKTAFTAAVLNYAYRMEIGWLPTKQGAVTGHGIESQLQRDLLTAGIAMYDERPDIYLNVAGRFFKEFVPAKEFLYRANMNTQGDHYTAYRAKWEFLATWVMDAIGAPMVYGPDQQAELYWTLYARRPDGQLLRDGDGSRNNAMAGTYISDYYRAMLLASSYYSDPYLKQEGARELPYLRTFSPSGNQSMNAVEFLIFNDPDLTGRPTSELPLTQYYPEPKGGMIARTGWQDGIDSPAVVAEMKINEYWTANHQHLDAGSFQIYYKGALATDTGYYQAGLRSGTTNPNNDGNSDYGSLHFYNYYRRTIAHNAMLIYDPGEPSANFAGRANDGGQRFPNSAKEVNLITDLLDPAKGYQTGAVLGHEFGEDPLEPNYTYLKGDLTKAYSDKITGYERSFMFLNLKDQEHPAAMLVFDRVAASNENFKKSWLLHGLQEPIINGSQTVFKDTRSGYNGKLTVDTLLPKADNLAITPVGGPDQEFWVQDTNYFAIPVSGGNNEGGGWRIEVSPLAANETDYFLNVLQVGDANPDMPPLPVTAIETAQVAGAQIADRVVIFGKEKTRTRADVQFSFAGDGEYEITVADLEKGTWQVAKDGAPLTQASATDEGGVIVFRGTAGSYTLTYMNDQVNRPVIEIPELQHEGIAIRVNNRLLYTGGLPTMREGTLLTPVLPVLTKLGVQTTMDETTQTITATKDGRVLQLTVDSLTAYVDGEPAALDVPMTVIGGQFYAPVRFAAETFYARAEWDAFAKIMNIHPYTGPAPGTGGGTPIPIQASEWSAHFENETGPRSYDNNVDTTWSVSGTEGQWILYDLGGVVDVKGASIMWNKGDERQAIFDMEVSSDKQNWTPVFDGRASGQAAFTYEDFLFPADTEARYVRINCKGNTISQWNAIIEIKFFN